jgi:hypothetical protein
MKEDINYSVIYILILIATGIMLVNEYLLLGIGAGITGNVIASTSSVSLSEVIPKGIPAVYGQELGISYDDVSSNNPTKADQTIEKLGSYDNKISLSGDKLQRYIDTASQISCEYCCGAPSIIFTKDTGQYKAGDAACGCAHSFAMRGLAKYLLTNHPDMTNDQILEELGKWKTLFFPGIMIQKAQVLEQNGIEFNYINLASNKYRGIEKGATNGGGMVGGC